MTIPDGFWEQVHAESLRAVAEDVRDGKMPPPQCASLLDRAADMIETLKSEIKKLATLREMDRNPPVATIPYDDERLAQFSDAEARLLAASGDLLVACQAAVDCSPRDVNVERLLRVAIGKALGA